MSLDYSAVVQYMANLLSSAEGVGRVHPFQYATNDPKEFRSLFCTLKEDGTPYKLNGWMISRRNFSDDHIGTNQADEVQHPFVIYGYYEYEPEIASEVTFNQIIERIRRIFRDDYRLGGLCELTTPIQAETIDFVPYGGSLAHFCRLTISVQEYYDNDTQ